MPARISCLIRCSWSPPYSRSVTLRRSCSFSGTSESSSSSGTRPTCATRIRAVNCAESGSDSCTRTGSPTASVKQVQRQTLRIQRRVGLVLPALVGQRLPEIPGAVVEPDRDQRHPQIGCGLQVVTGEDPQAAGVVGQHLGDAEFHREVRDRRGHCDARLLLLLVPQRAGQVIVQRTGQLVEPAQEFLVERQLVEARGTDGAQQFHRIIAATGPQRRIDGGEQTASPCPKTTADSSIAVPTRRGVRVDERGR